MKEIQSILNHNNEDPNQTIKSHETGHEGLSNTPLRIGHDLNNLTDTDLNRDHGMDRNEGDHGQSKTHNGLVFLDESHEMSSPFDDDPPLRVLTTDRVYGEDDEANFEVEALDVVNKASGRHISFHVVTTKRDHPGVVCIITKQLSNGETGILLGQHWRPATGKWAWELPRGMGDLGESLEDTAIRETKEETGISIPKSDVEVLQSIQADTGVLSNSIGVVVLEASEDSYAIQEHDWELSHMDWWTMDEINRAISRGLITCGITLSALMIYSTRQ